MADPPDDTLTNLDEITADFEAAAGAYVTQRRRLVAAIVAALKKHPPAVVSEHSHWSDSYVRRVGRAGGAPPATRGPKPRKDPPS